MKEDKTYSIPYSQTTYQEMRFLDQLGSWARHAGKPEGVGIPRKELLGLYLNTMHLRDNWGYIDEEKIRKYILLLLRGM